VEPWRGLQELWLREQLSALLLQTGHREALLPDGALLSTAVCLSKTVLLQPLLWGAQVLRSGSVCRSSVLRSAEVLRSGSGLRPGVLRSGSVCRSSLLRSSEVLPGSRDLRLPGSSVLRSSEVLPGPGDLWLPGPALLPGSGFVLCSGLCAEVLRSGSGELLCPGRSGLQHVQYLQQRLQHVWLAQRVGHVPPQQGRLLPDLVHHDEGLLCGSLRSRGPDLQVANGVLR
jgi:hypothetical protein